MSERSCYATIELDYMPDVCSLDYGSVAVADIYALRRIGFGLFGYWVATDNAVEAIMVDALLAATGHV